MKDSPKNLDDKQREKIKMVNDFINSHLDDEKTGGETQISSNKKTNKYLRPIKTSNEGLIDIYDVLEIFEVKCPARQHAIKKLLCAGMRGKGDTLQDLEETAGAVQRAIELEKNRNKLGIKIDK